MGSASDLAQLLRIYWSLLLGNILEWYEFAIYGYLESYLEKNFFRGSAVATWLGFTATFVARPLGGFFLGLVGDRVGRKAATMLSIAGMLIGTVGQGLLPSPLSSGDNVTLGNIGVGLLVVLRLLQGLCTGGEISTVSTYITEVGSPRSLGRSIALVSITCNLGFLLGRALVWSVETHLGEERMMNWGWRLPFIFALLPGVIAVCGRQCLPESEAFTKIHAHDGDAVDSSDSDEQPGATVWSTLRDLCRSHGLSVLVGIFGVTSYAVFQYGGMIWAHSFLKKHGTPVDNLMTAGICARFLEIVLALPIGWLADVNGVAWVTFVGAWSIMVAGLPLFIGLQWDPTNPTSVFVTYAIAYGLIGSISGTVFFMYVVELFPTEVRNLGVGVSYNIGFCIFGGFSPLLAQESLNWSPYGPGYVLSAAGCVSFVSILWSIHLQRAGKVHRLAYVRPVPYFGSWAHGARACDDSDGDDGLMKEEVAANEDIQSD